MRIPVVLVLTSCLAGCAQLPTPQWLAKEEPSQQSQQQSPTNGPLPLYDLVTHDPNCIAQPADLAAYPGPQHDDLWQRLRAGFQLDYQDHSRITTHRDWYARNPGYIKRVTERAGRYMYSIVEKLEEQNMPMELALLPVVESAFDPFAYSHGRAAGMWQFIPATGQRFGLNRNYWYDGRRDIEESTRAALEYLSYLHQLFDGDWLHALAAYNTGEGNLRRAIRRNQRAGLPTDFWSLKLPRETRAYVPQLLALSEIIKDPAAFNVALTPIPNQPFYAVVELDSQIDLAKAAELAELDMDDLYYLNPAFNRWATDPGGPHRLLIPVEKVALFQENLEKNPPEKRLGWDNYQVKKGDSLLKIARRYNTTPEVIKRSNGLSGNIIRIGQELLIPVATQSGDHYAYSQTQRTQRTQATSNGSPGSHKVTYVVEPGDSFWKIARRYDVQVGQLAKWNAMAPRDPLRVGQKLVVWTQNQESARQALNQQPNSPLVRKIAYRVRPGDSLARIASRFNLTVKEILNWNAIQPSKYIHPGQHLTLWVDLTEAH